jgi:hypothetical protein
MCQALTCEQCGRPTWAGCGAHVEAVLGHVPVEERCAGHEASSDASSTTAPSRG